MGLFSMGKVPANTAEGLFGGHLIDVLVRADARPLVNSNAFGSSYQVGRMRGGPGGDIRCLLAGDVSEIRLPTWTSSLTLSEGFREMHAHECLA